jgi:serine/threonine protein kinase
MTVIGSGAFSSVAVKDGFAVKTYSTEDKFDASKEIDTLNILKNNKNNFKDKFAQEYGYMPSSSIVTLEKYTYEAGIAELYFKRYACNLLELMESVKTDVLFAKHVYHKIMIGLYELQLSGIIHGDLKPENIMLGLIGKEGNKNALVKHLKAGKSETEVLVKIIDFNKAVNSKQAIKPMDIQTLYYTPPEIILGCRDYNHSVDIWTAGCILFEMLTHKHLFNVYNKPDCFSSVQEDPEVESSEESSGSGTYESTRFEHLALMHVYNVSLPGFPDTGTAEFAEDYFVNGKLIGSVPWTLKTNIFGKWCSLIDTIFERTFHYDYDKRLSIDEYLSLYGRDNKR